MDYKPIEEVAKYLVSAVHILRMILGPEKGIETALVNLVVYKFQNRYYVVVPKFMGNTEFLKNVIVSEGHK